jgi:hypothetical protein
VLRIEGTDNDALRQYVYFTTYLVGETRVIHPSRTKAVFTTLALMVSMMSPMFIGDVTDGLD